MAKIGIRAMEQLTKDKEAEQVMEQALAKYNLSYL